MSQTEPDPSQSTEMFRAFVERGAADRAGTTTGRRVPPAAIAGIAAFVVVLALLVWLVF